MEASKSSTCEPECRFVLNRSGSGGSKNAAGIMVITQGGYPGRMSALSLAATVPGGQGCTVRDACYLLLHPRRGGSLLREDTLE